MDKKTPCKSDYAKLIVPRLYRGPSGLILGHGVKPMPQLRQMNLLAPQRELFEFLGFSW